MSLVTQGQEVKPRIIIMKTMFAPLMFPEIPGSKSKAENPSRKCCWLELRRQWWDQGPEEGIFLGFQEQGQGGRGGGGPPGKQQPAEGEESPKLQKQQLDLMFLEASLLLEPICSPFSEISGLAPQEICL